MVQLTFPWRPPFFTTTTFLCPQGGRCEVDIIVFVMIVFCFYFIISFFTFRPNVCKHRIPIGVFRKCRKIPGKRRLQCRYINYISKPPKWWLSGSLRICDCLFSICAGPNSIIWQNIGAVPDIPKWKKVPDVQKVWPRCAIGPGPSTLHDWEGSSYWTVFTPY